MCSKRKLRGMQIHLVYSKFQSHFFQSFLTTADTASSQSTPDAATFCKINFLPEAVAPLYSKGQIDSQADSPSRVSWLPRQTYSYLSSVCHFLGPRKGPTLWSPAKSATQCQSCQLKGHDRIGEPDARQT